MASYQYMGDNGGCFQNCLKNDDGAASSSSSLSLGSSMSHNMRYNDTQQKMKSTEDFLASELSNLSVQERSKALEDLHCVGEDLTETSELIETSLLEMDRIIRERNEPIYNTATSQNRSYVEDPVFRLRFLRANNHDARKSANQMLWFLLNKQKYFGRDKLARDITVDDLNEEDMELLLSGVLHIQDGTDRNGRVVVFVQNGAAYFEAKTEVLIRLFYFVYFNILCPLECVQRKGIAFCFYDMSTPNKPAFVHKRRLEANLKFIDAITKIPIRRSAVHACLKEIPGSLASNNIILLRLLQRFQRSVVTRVRIHYGSDIELQYSLRSHGLPPKTMPIDTSGNIRKDILHVWFHKYTTGEWEKMFAYASNMPLSAVAKQHPATEDHPENAVGKSLDYKNKNNGQGITSDLRGHCKRPTTSVGRFIEPTSTDVLLGRGRGHYMHPGNIRFRAFLKEYQDEYNNTPRYSRVKTPTELTHLLLEEGIRFLQRSESGDGWVESDFSEAEKKVKQFFRSGKKLK